MPEMGRTPSHHALLILSSLAAGDRHGYAIKKEIARRTNGETALGSTTLYRLLGQLLDQGLIVERADPAAETDERRRCYRLTASGKRALAAEVARLERLLLATRSAGGRRLS
jgi:DNA-binding PadR family transcriptional regulator